MTLNETQKRKIKEIISEKMNKKINEYTEREDMNKPFYFALFSKKSVYSASILQSTYTSFGYIWETLAEIVGRGNSDVKRFEKHYILHGSITSKEQEIIYDILFELDRGGKIANYEENKKKLNLVYQVNDPKKPINQVIDFFVELNDGREIYFENKSVKPNKNEMKAAKSDLLEILAMRQKEKNIDQIDAVVSMPYNPYFEKSFDRWTTTKFFEVGKDLLIGKDFWDTLGGENTYQDLLEIFHEVGEEVSEKLDAFIADLDDSDFSDIKYILK